MYCKSLAEVAPPAQGKPSPRTVMNTMEMERDVFPLPTLAKELEIRSENLHNGMGVRDYPWHESRGLLRRGQLLPRASGMTPVRLHKYSPGIRSATVHFQQDGTDEHPCHSARTYSLRCWASRFGVAPSAVATASLPRYGPCTASSLKRAVTSTTLLQAPAGSWIRQHYQVGFLRYSFRQLTNAWASLRGNPLPPTSSSSLRGWPHHL